MKETRKTPPISKAQREIMEIVWQRVRSESGRSGGPSPLADP